MFNTFQLDQECRQIPFCMILIEPYLNWMKNWKAKFAEVIIEKLLFWVIVSVQKCWFMIDKTMISNFFSCFLSDDLTKILLDCVWTSNSESCLWVQNALIMTSWIQCEMHFDNFFLFIFLLQYFYFVLFPCL